MSNFCLAFFCVCFQGQKKYKYFWKYCSVRTKKLHNKQQSQAQSDGCKISTDGVPISSNHRSIWNLVSLTPEDSDCTVRMLLIVSIFFQYWPGSPNGPKQKSRTTKSPLMQDWVFRLGVWLFSFVVWNLWYHYMWPQQLLGLVWSWSNSLFSLLSSKANYSHNMVAWNTFFIFDLSFKVHVYLHMETYEANGWCFDRWFSIGIC